MALIDEEVSDTVVDMYVRGFFQSLHEKIVSLVPEISARFSNIQTQSLMFPQKAMTSLGVGLNPQHPSANLKLSATPKPFINQISEQSSKQGEMGGDYRIDHNRTFVEEPAKRMGMSRNSV